MAVSKVQPSRIMAPSVQAPKGALKTSAAKKEVTTATPSAAKTVAKYAVAALAVSAAAYGASVGYQAYTVAPTFFEKASGLVFDAANGTKDFVVNHPVATGVSTALAASAAYVAKEMANLFALQRAVALFEEPPPLKEPLSLAVATFSLLALPLPPAMIFLDFMFRRR